ncbi:hypothetical protein KRR26_20605 [Corallococcus sp. M34]|uniref:hypothetical protein n=1 Tax=Citreicoccus inhibens TaxID=2849499 RepID=UPI001C24ABA6|nr:hypothetical protein [Citreicoccus inhibens]MBU8898021.1 hypothetical protein [Citreicoccus inhibens]
MAEAITPPRPGDGAPISTSLDFDPPRYVDHVPIPPGVAVKEDGVAFLHGQFKVSALTMVLISLSIFWVPFFGSLIASTFGGFLAKKLPRAMYAAAVSSIVVPATLYVFFNVFAMGFVRFFSGLGLWNWTLLHIIATFIGAFAGAASQGLVAEEFVGPEFATVSGPPVSRTDDARRAPRP